MNRFLLGTGRKFSGGFLPAMIYGIDAGNNSKFLRTLCFKEENFGYGFF